MRIMDKQSFLKKYRSEHSEIWAYLVLEIILDVVGAIIIVVNAKELIGYHSRHDEPKLVFLIFLGLFFWILGLVFLGRIKSVESEGNKEYERYLISCSTNQNSNDTGAWMCSKCGRYNENSRLLCCQCSEPKPYVIIQRVNKPQRGNNTVDVDSWICPNCGIQNKNYVGTCGCGEVKPR